SPYNLITWLGYAFGKGRAADHAAMLRPCGCRGRSCRGYRLGVGGMRIAGGEGDEQIAGTVAGNATGPGETKGSTASQAFQLMREKRRVCCNHDDDGTSFSFVNGAGDFLADFESTNR